MKENGLSELQQKIDALSVYSRALHALLPPVDETERQAADALRSFISTSLEDCRRKRDGQTATLSFLYRLKQGMQDAAGTLEHAFSTRAIDLAGWRYGLPTQNKTQAVVGVINELILSAAASIIEIEQQFPALREHFQSERAERARASQT